MVLGRPTSLLPFALASKACLGSLSWGFLLTWPNHLSCDLSIRRNNGSMWTGFRTSELRTVLNSVCNSFDSTSKPHFGRLHLWSHSFDHYPRFMTISENGGQKLFWNLRALPFLTILVSWLPSSSVGGGGLEPPHWLVKYAKTHVFCAFEADFLWKMENSPPHTKIAPP